MAFRLQNFAPLGPEEFVWGWAHILKGIKRRIFNHPAGRFLDRYVAQGAPIEAVHTADNTQALCYICGYAMAAIVADDGWCIEACSATTAKAMLGNERYTAWRKRLPPVSKDVAATGKPSSHLQTSGH